MYSHVFFIDTFEVYKCKLIIVHDNHIHMKSVLRGENLTCEKASDAFLLLEHEVGLE